MYSALSDGPERSKSDSAVKVVLFQADGDSFTGGDARHPDRPAAPFAVNQIVHRSNDRLARDLEVCAKFQAPIVITSLGAHEEVNASVHSAWKDIWGSGQGIGAIQKTVPVSAFVDRLESEYLSAK